MTDIREQILSNKPKQNGFEMISASPFADASKTIKASASVYTRTTVLECMDEYALLVLEYVRKDFNFNETYISDLKAYLEEIKTELKP